jgi:hypothetical protein
VNLGDRFLQSEELNIFSDFGGGGQDEMTILCGLGGIFEQPGSLKDIFRVYGNGNSAAGERFDPDQPQILESCVLHTSGHEADILWFFGSDQDDGKFLPYVLSPRRFYRNHGSIINKAQENGELKRR